MYFRNFSICFWEDDNPNSICLREVNYVLGIGLFAVGLIYLLPIYLLSIYLSFLHSRFIRFLLYMRSYSMHRGHSNEQGNKGPCPNEVYSLGRRDRYHKINNKYMSDGSVCREKQHSRQGAGEGWGHCFS